MEDKEFRARLFRVRDVCRLLSLPPSTVYRMISLGRLKAIRVPTSKAPLRGVVRIPREEVERLLGDSHEYLPVEEV